VRRAYRWFQPMLVAISVLAMLVSCGALDRGAMANANLGVLASASGGHAARPNDRSSDRYPISVEKWALWTEGTRLRGANIYQRRVYPELDDGCMGSGPVGPPHTQRGFDRLSAMGANYVNVSHPGLFAEMPPYVLNENMQANLDTLLGMIADADMFAVISFRTGPGRSEFTFMLDEVGDWFDASYLNDAVWREQAAQDAWVAMWRYTAECYQDNPIIVGYDLMVEPNSNEVWLNEWDADEFYVNHAGTLYDWNPLQARITSAIRQVDGDTPILVGGMAYSCVEWLPYVQPNGDSRTVYTVHQYAPVVYTHQGPPLTRTYPGTFDADWDGIPERVDHSWLDSLLLTVDDFALAHGVPMAANEFGLMRWEPGAAQFMDDEMDLFEQRGMNYALWEWPSGYEGQADNDAFNFLHGPNPGNHSDVDGSELITVIEKYWARNTVRPSSFWAVTPAPTLAATPTRTLTAMPTSTVTVTPTPTVAVTATATLVPAMRVYLPIILKHR